MANRDENLKKINEELEKLDDEQLEKIAGGWTEIRNVMAITKNPTQFDPRIDINK